MNRERNQVTKNINYINMKNRAVVILVKKYYK